MNRNYPTSQQYLAFILLISLFLQSCGGGFENNPLVSTGEEQIAFIQTDVQPLVDQVLTAQGGHIVTFYETHGKVKADVGMNVPKGFSKTYEGLEVVVEQGTEVAKLLCLDKKVQEHRIQLQLAQGKNPAKVIIYKGAGLMGGSRTGNSKGKQNDQPKEKRRKAKRNKKRKTATKEIKVLDDVDAKSARNRYPTLLEIATEGKVEEQFQLAQIAYYEAKRAYLTANILLNKAAEQGHLKAINLLNQLKENKENELPGLFNMEAEQIRQRNSKVIHKLAVEHEHSINGTEVFCPTCKENRRHFYRLAKGSIILYCSECSSIWLDPKNTGWGEAASEEKLQDVFGKDFELLFDEGNWATKSEVENSSWTIVENILSLIKES
jgi:hypothetical protein